ncbi:MAG: DUF4241 domain-containing protein [Ferruginibacter sp.]
MTQPIIPGFLEDVFFNDFSITDTTNNKLSFYVSEVGLLKIVDGKIIACDPLLYNDDLPFTTSFPIGQFPVQLAIAKINTDERVGFSRIKFSNEKPVTWTIAICEGQDLEELEIEEIFGYGVDAGIGAFMDSSGGKEYLKFLLEKQDNFEIIIEEMQKTYKDTWSWLLWERNDCNIAMFSSGWGDGFYASYIGYDSNKNICRLVTDFDLIS